MYNSRREAVQAILTRLEQKGYYNPSTETPRLLDCYGEQFPYEDIDGIQGPIQIETDKFGFIVGHDPKVDAYMVTIHV
jgi:tricorn protease-like protein